MSRRCLRSIQIFVAVQPYSVREAQNMLACFCERTSVWAERLLMSKTVALATISTQCGFTNGAGWTVTIPISQISDISILSHWQLFNKSFFIIFWRQFSHTDVRLFMSKTVASATISTQCGFTNGAGWTVTKISIFLKKGVDKWMGEWYYKRVLFERTATKQVFEKT